MLLLLLGVLSSLVVSSAFAQKMNSGWYWPTGTSDFGGYLGWLGYNNSTYPYHLAQDMSNPLDGVVYSIGEGEVIAARTDISGYGPNFSKGGALLARYQAGDGTWFTCLYGHLDRSHAAGTIHAGEVLGYTSEFSPPHLHLGIHPGYDPEPTNPWRGYTSSTTTTYGFTDPISFLNSHPPIDPLIAGLARTTQPVRWYYIMNQSTGKWYIVSPTGEVVYLLDRVDETTSFGVFWKPVNNCTFQSYPSAGRTFSSVTISADGRTISFGPAISSLGDLNVAGLANSTQPVRWFYIMNQTGYWYIVSPTGEVVYLLDRVDKSTSFGIFWKPINNAAFQEYPAAGHNYTSVTVSSDGKTIEFGSFGQ